MFDSLKPFTGFLTALIIGIVLITFRGEVRKLVNWIVAFKRIAKTKEGYSLEGASEPRVAPSPSAQNDFEAISAVEIKSSPTPIADSAEQDSWYIAFTEERYKDATRLLEIEQAKSVDRDRRIALKSIIGNIKFKQNPALGVAYFEALVRESPTEDSPYRWWALTYSGENLYGKCLEVLERGLLAVERKAPLLELKSDCLVCPVSYRC